MNLNERASILAELSPPFVIHEPEEQLTPVVFCSPHSGRIYPQAFLAASRLDPHTLRKSEDCYVDELFLPVVDLGAPLIAARFPRAYLDVNREPYELDPELFSGRLPDFANTQSARVIGGLGTIARIVADSEEIYRERMPIGVPFERIEQLYRPFHAALAGLLEATRKRFGVAVLIDCHSMPSSAIGQPPGARPHFVLGDRFGASCDAKLTRFVRDLLVIRLKHPPTPTSLAALNEDFADIIAGDPFHLIPPTPEEADDAEHLDFHRIAFGFNRHDYGRLRQLIDVLNHY